MRGSSRDALLTRYELRSRVFDEIANRRRSVRPTYPPSAQAPVQQEVAKEIPTSRELEVLALMAEGLTDSEIATRLYVTLNTVKTHVKRVLVKLDARSRAHAVAVGFRRDLIR